MEKRDILNYLGEKIGELELPEGTSEEVWAAKLAVYAVAPPTLAEEKAIKISKAQEAIRAFVNESYSLEQRFNFNAMYLVAVQNGLTNRAAYIFQLFNWANSVVQYAAQFAAAVNALTTVEEVQSHYWDFSALALSDPKISPVVAVSITN